MARGARRVGTKRGGGARLLGVALALGFPGAARAHHDTDIVSAIRTWIADTDRYRGIPDPGWEYQGPNHETVYRPSYTLRNIPWGPLWEAKIGDIPAWVAYLRHGGKVAMLLASKQRFYKDEGNTHGTATVYYDMRKFIDSKLPPALANRPEVQLLREKFNRAKGYYEGCNNGVPLHQGACGGGGPSF